MALVVSLQTQAGYRGGGSSNLGDWMTWGGAMNLEETRKYIERRMGDVGLNVRIDNSGYQAIQKYTSGDKERLNQLYYKLVSVGSRQEKREVNGVTIQIAIDDLRRMDEFMDHMPARIEHNDKVDVDRLTIEQLASSLEQKVAEEIEFAVEEVRRKAAPTSAEGGGPNGTDHFVAPAEQIETIIAPATAGTPGKPRVLVVDDSPTIRAAVTKALENDFELVQAPDGEKGWEALCADASVKLVVTDLMMPGMDGFALIERIRSAKVPGVAGLPIIVVTALEDPQAKVHALVAGANDFITKRTDTLELQARVMARYQLSQIVGNGEFTSGSRSTKDSGPPPQEIAAALLGTRSSTTYGRQSVNIAAAAKRYGRINRDSSNTNAVSTGPLNADAGASFETEQAGNRTWVRALGLDRLARMSSTTGITLLASVVVVAVILGILYVNRFPSEVAIRAGETRAVPAANRDTDSGAADIVQLPGAEDTPRVSDKRKTANAESAESWTTADGSPARETLPPSPNETPEPQASKELIATKVKPEPVSVKQRARPKTEAAPVVTAAQALPRTAKESAAPVVKAETTQVDVDVPTSKNISQAEMNVAPTDPVARSTPVPASDNASTTITEPTSVVVSTKPDLVEPPPTNVPQLTPPPVAEFTPNVPTAAPDSLVATVGPPGADGGVVSSTKLTKAELASLIKRFVFVYQAGDIQQFLSLFDDNVRTNDRTTKAGLRKDYDDLFRNTSMRQMVLGDISWDIKDRQAEGAANFEVRVRRINEQEVKVYQGSLTFHVEKTNDRIRIIRMYHGQWKAQS